MSIPLEIKANPARAAWLTLLVGFPVAYVASFAIGSAVAAAVGLPEGEILPPAAALLVLVLNALVLAGLCFLVLRFGRRAAHAGRRRALLPAWITIGLSSFSVGISVVSYILARVGG